MNWKLELLKRKKDYSWLTTEGTYQIIKTL
jgi:hypothetical protein